MKKILITTLTLGIMMFIFVSCNKPKDVDSEVSKEESTSLISNTTSGEEKNMLEKLYQIEKGWTLDQVIGLLGEPDELNEAGLGSSRIYYVCDTEKAFILFGDNKVFQIAIKNMETDEINYLFE